MVMPSIASLRHFCFCLYISVISVISNINVTSQKINVTSQKISVISNINVTSQRMRCSISVSFSVDHSREIIQYMLDEHLICGIKG